MRQHRETPPTLLLLTPQRLVIVLLAAAIAAGAHASEPSTFEPPRADGFAGAWYHISPRKKKDILKYSGGMGTFPHVILPMAQYSPIVDKTFFVWGGADNENRLQTNVSYFDHATGEVARPRILRQFDMNDAHDTAAISIAPDGHLWVFSTVHGNDTERGGRLFRSTQPYAIDSWEQRDIPKEIDREGVLNYAQPWQVHDRGMLLLFTRYTDGRQLYFSTTTDNGQTWSPRTMLSVLPGHYQISWQHGQRVGTAFNRHPGSNVDARTDLFYMQTDNLGESWQSADGSQVAIPIKSVIANPLVRDYSNEGRLVYLKDMKFDGEGNPVILYITSDGSEPGPYDRPRQWELAHWKEGAWRFLKITKADHNYDYGSLYIEEDGTWRVVAPTEPGPQPRHTGGDVAAWVSSDEGASWAIQRRLTSRSMFNHSFVRGPLNPHPEFYAFWVDGDPRRESKSSLYFCNQQGDVYRLPRSMGGDSAAVESLRVYDKAAAVGAVPTLIEATSKDELHPGKR